MKSKSRVSIQIRANSWGLSSTQSQESGAVGRYSGGQADNERHIEMGVSKGGCMGGNWECGHLGPNEEVNRRVNSQLHILFHERMERNPRSSFHDAEQSRRKRGIDQRGTHLFGFLILSILHRVVDMAQHILDRIRVRQIKWKKRHQRMVFNLLVTSCETASEKCFISKR